MGRRDGYLAKRVLEFSPPFAGLDLGVRFRVELVAIDLLSLKFLRLPLCDRIRVCGRLGVVGLACRMCLTEESDAAVPATGSGRGCL